MRRSVCPVFQAEGGRGRNMVLMIYGDLVRIMMTWKR